MLCWWIFVGNVFFFVLFCLVLCQVQFILLLVVKTLKSLSSYTETNKEMKILMFMLVFGKLLSLYDELGTTNKLSITIEKISVN